MSLKDRQRLRKLAYLEEKEVQEEHEALVEELVAMQPSAEEAADDDTVVVERGE